MPVLHIGSGTPAAARLLAEIDFMMMALSVPTMAEMSRSAKRAIVEGWTLGEDFVVLGGSFVSAIAAS
jgi:hypothetical protein